MGGGQSRNRGSRRASGDDGATAESGEGGAAVRQVVVGGQRVTMYNPNAGGAPEAAAMEPAPAARGVCARVESVMAVCSVHVTPPVIALWSGYSIWT
jgi:hypothetical protein